MVCYNIIGTEKLRFVAPMPEQIGTPTMHFSKGHVKIFQHQYEPLDPSQKNNVGVVICSGMGATNLIFKARTYFTSVTIREQFTRTIYKNYELYNLTFISISFTEINI